jgi:hypothetical protein
MALGHHLGLQLHLKLFAALPKAFGIVLETSRALCIPVYMSALSRRNELDGIPHGTFNKLPQHLLHSCVLLKALKQRLLCQRSREICPRVLVRPYKSAERCNNMLQTRGINFTADVGNQCVCDCIPEMVHDIL